MQQESSPLRPATPDNCPNTDDLHKGPSQIEASMYNSVAKPPVFPVKDAGSPTPPPTDWHHNEAPENPVSIDTVTVLIEISADAYYRIKRDDDGLARKLMRWLEIRIREFVKSPSDDGGVTVLVSFEVGKIVSKIVGDGDMNQSCV